MLAGVNWDYLKQVKDPYIFFKISLIKTDKSSKKLSRVLVVNPCLIGDFMVSLPALRTFIKHHPNLMVDLIVTPPLKKLAENIKRIRKVFVAESSTSRDLERTEKKEIQKFDDYDEIIVMRPSQESYDLIKHICAGKIKTPLFKIFKYLFYSVRDVFLKKLPVQRREIDFNVLDENVEDVKFKDIFDFGEKDYNQIKKLDAMKTEDKKIIIHTGPVWIMRRWGNDKWADLIKKINASGKFRFIFVGTGDEEANYREISKKLGFKTYSLINKVHLEELMLILRLSDYFIGIDSGPRNMAHIADIPSVTLFGPAASGAIYMPWTKRDVVIDKSNGGGLYQAFFYKKNGFINQITPDEVFEAFKRLSSKKK